MSYLTEIMTRFGSPVLRKFHGTSGSVVIHFPHEESIIVEGAMIGPAVSDAEDSLGSGGGMETGDIIWRRRVTVPLESRPAEGVSVTIDGDDGWSVERTTGAASSWTLHVAKYETQSFRMAGLRS